MLSKFFTKFFRRPFPRNLHALRSCRISYSQFGEDLLLTSLLGYEKTDGVYVDLGCYHPINLSNTYIFYQRGWRGIAIDANSEWTSEWKKYRPRDLFINEAVSASATKLYYLMDRSYPACNQTVRDEPLVTRADQTVVAIQSRSLDQLLDQHLPDGNIDLLNIDVEGLDLEIIKSMDFAVRKPRVIAAEDSDVGLDSELSKFLRSRGYLCKAHIGLTKCFQLE